MTSILEVFFLIHFTSLNQIPKFKRVLICKQVVLQHITILLYQQTKYKAYLFLELFEQAIDTGNYE